MCVVDPEADTRALEWSAREVGELDHAGKRVAVEDPVQVLGRGQAVALCLEGEEGLGAERLERPVWLAVGDEEPRQLFGVVGCQAPDHGGPPLGTVSARSCGASFAH